MKITKKEIDRLNLELTLSIAADDYAEGRKKKLGDYRRRAEIKGFRKGMVPSSLIEKMYGQSALVDSVNDVISESLNKYINDNKLRVIGEPLPSEGQPSVEWTAGNDFTFKFDVALTPEISFELGKDDTIPYYNITVTETAKKEMKENLLKQYGSWEAESKTLTPAEENQETYDKIFGEGKVKSAEEFMAKIEERLVAEYAQEAEFRFSKDARDYIMKKAAVEVPEKFLRRWLIVANEGKFTAEQIDKDFEGFLKDYRWQLVRDYLAEKYNVKVEKEDMLASARSFAAYQFAMYGIVNAPAEQIDAFAQNILSQENESRRVYEQVAEQKTLKAVREQVTVKTKKISVDKFRELK